MLDPELFTQKQIHDLEKFDSRCVEATTAAAIENTGTALDERRAKQHAKIRKELARDKALNEFYKQLIFEVPRRMNEVGTMEAVVK